MATTGRPGAAFPQKDETAFDARSAHEKLAETAGCSGAKIPQTRPALARLDAWEEAPCHAANQAAARLDEKEKLLFHAINQAVIWLDEKEKLLFHAINQAAARLDTWEETPCHAANQAAAGLDEREEALFHSSASPGKGSTRADFAFSALAAHHVRAVARSDPGASRAAGSTSGAGYSAH